LRRPFRRGYGAEMMRRSAAGIALLLLVCACGTSPANSPRDARVEGKTEASLLETNKRVVLRFLQEAVIDGNAAVVDELCTTDVVNHAAAGNNQGIEGIRR